MVVKAGSSLPYLFHIGRVGGGEVGVSPCSRCRGVWCGAMWDNYVFFFFQRFSKYLQNGDSHTGGKCGRYTILLLFFLQYFNKLPQCGRGIWDRACCMLQAKHTKASWGVLWVKHSLFVFIFQKKFTKLLHRPEYLGMAKYICFSVCFLCTEPGPHVCRDVLSLFPFVDMVQPLLFFLANRRHTNSLSEVICFSYFLSPF